MALHSAETRPAWSRTASEGTDRSCILTVNGGSSSLKFALFAGADRPVRLLSGRVERVGRAGSRLVVGEGGQEEDGAVEAPDQAAAVRFLIQRLESLVGTKNIAVVGHRVVHGGSRFYRPELITPEILEELRKIVPY